MMKKLGRKSGQSTVEYVIVFTAIATALIIAATQIIRPAVNSTYSQAGSSINQAGNYFGRTAGMGWINRR